MATKKVEDSKLEKQKVDLIVIGNQNSGKTSLIKRFV
jgi:GTPase SAR1 family protein